MGTEVKNLPLAEAQARLDEQLRPRLERSERRSPG